MIIIMLRLVAATIIYRKTNSFNRKTFTLSKSFNGF
jgi:hypothetical protein